MTITNVERTQIGNMTTVTVTSDLEPPVYYHWYEDGQWVGRTTTPSHTVFVPAGGQRRLDVVDTTDPDYDPAAGEPGFPSRRTVHWIRSLDADVIRYRVEVQVDGGDWETAATVPAVSGQWAYTWLSDVLVDCAEYAWRVIPIDAAGNDGTPIAIDAELIVRHPDAPDYTVAFDPEDYKVTFFEAS
jgi:hypothetical protein